MILVAGAVALGAAFSVRSLMQSQVARAMKSAEAVDTAQVLVAARPIGAGAVLVAEDFRFDKWPKAIVGKDILVMTDKSDPSKQLLGQIARHDIAIGQPLGQTSIYKPEKGGKLAGMLDPGKRAVAINVTAESSVAGLASPGDYVDVVLSADMARAGGDRAKSSNEFLRYTAETVLENVKLLAIDQATTRLSGKEDKEGTKLVGKTATIEVDAEQAEVLILAGQMGKLSLVLRSVGKKDKDTREGEFTSDLKVSGALSSLFHRRKALPQESAPAPAPRSLDGGSVIINRGGDRSSKSF